MIFFPCMNKMNLLSCLSIGDRFSTLETSTLILMYIKLHHNIEIDRKLPKH